MIGDLRGHTVGAGPSLVLLHGTGTDSRVFEDSVRGLVGSFRTTTIDRRGWGGSPAGPDYRRTTVAEQSIEIAGVIRQQTDTPVTVAGIGFGAVIALELALAEPESVTAAIMIEPPLFDALPDATEGMSRDVESIRDAAATGGKAAAYELFWDGGLPVLGAGAERFRRWADLEPAATDTFLVELPAVPAWPLDPIRMASLETEVSVVTCPSTPELLRRAADTLTGRIPGCERIEATTEPTEAPIELLT